MAGLNHRPQFMPQAKAGQQREISEITRGINEINHGSAHKI